MNTLSLHAKACALFVCLALMFANAAGAIGMASSSHAGMGLDSSHCMHSSAAMDMTSDAVDHSNHAGHPEHLNITETDCMEDSSCIADCAAHCTSIAFTGCQALIAFSFVASYAPLVNHTPKSSVISGLYKPPKNLH